MPTRLHPGVYVEEIPSGIRAIEGVPTSTAIFVGETERGPLEPTKIHGPSDYERLFGGYMRQPDGSGNQQLLLPLSIRGFFENGGSSCYILRILDITGKPEKAHRSVVVGSDLTKKIVEAVDPGVWGNHLEVVVCPSSDGDRKRWRYVVRYQSPTEHTVENWDQLSDDPKDENYAPDALRRSRYVRWPEGVDVARPPLDLQIATNDLIESFIGGSLGGGNGGGSGAHISAGTITRSFLPKLEGIDDAALIVAAAEQLLDNAVTEYIDITKAFIEYCMNKRPKQDLFFVGDLPRSPGGWTEPSKVVRAVVDCKSSGGMPCDNFSALYWPHICVENPVGAGRNSTIVIPPAGHVAGVYARTDARRGVWKAPAGFEAQLSGIQSLDFKLLDGHSDELNPKGINALRSIPNAGPVVWGARTMQPASEWRYVPVRRTAIFLRLSIYYSIQWAVFEPNDEPLWAALRTSIGAFMEIQFRNGAFAGRTSKQAYFVKCDRETTPEEDQIAGIVNVLVGFAPLRPAEFVVVKLSQKTAGS